MTDEQSDDENQTRVNNPVVDPTGATAEQPTVARDTPEGTGPGGSVRGGAGLGATGPGGDTDVRGPAETGPAAGGQSPLDAQRRAEEAKDAYAERPHVFVAGAFVGGLLAAQLLKRIGGGDD